MHATRRAWLVAAIVTLLNANLAMAATQADLSKELDALEGCLEDVSQLLGLIDQYLENDYLGEIYRILSESEGLFKAKDVCEKANKFDGMCSAQKSMLQNAHVAANEFVETLTSQPVTPASSPSTTSPAPTPATGMSRVPSSVTSRRTPSMRRQATSTVISRQPSPAVNGQNRRVSIRRTPVPKTVRNSPPKQKDEPK